MDYDITGKAVTTPTVHHPLSTIPTFNTIQHTPTPHPSLLTTTPSNTHHKMRHCTTQSMTQLLTWSTMILCSAFKMKAIHLWDKGT